MRTFHLFWIFVFGISLRAQVQDTTGNNDQGIELSAVALGRDIERLAVSINGKLVPWQVPAFERSLPLAYTGSRKVIFFRLPPDGAPPEVKPIPVADIQLPEKGRRWLLLFASNADGTYNIYPLPGDDELYSYGSARFFNTTTGFLAVKANGQSFQLRPGELRIVAGNGRKISVIVAVADGESWKIVGSTVLPLFSSKRREIIFSGGAADYFKRTDADGRVIKASPVQIFSVDD